MFTYTLQLILTHPVQRERKVTLRIVFFWLKEQLYSQHVTDSVGISLKPLPAPAAAAAAAMPVPELLVLGTSTLPLY